MGVPQLHVLLRLLRDGLVQVVEFGVMRRAVFVRLPQVSVCAVLVGGRVLREGGALDAHGDVTFLAGLHVAEADGAPAVVRPEGAWPLEVHLGIVKYIKEFVPR